MLIELPIVFHSQGVPLVGRFFRNTSDLQERQRTVITMGSWLTVKEQMATTYARRLAELGYTAFVFDFTEQDPDAMVDQMERFAREVRPRVSRSRG